ncbi:DUF418 domain-containing protein [Oerskovia turbata]
MSTAAPDALPRRRWGFIDALRGFALCGILFVNLPDLASVGADLPADEQRSSGVAVAYDFLVQTRFVAIFTFLFGMSAAMVLDSARRRSTRPRRILARRFALLLALGIAHLLTVGANIDVLTPYGVAGLVILIPCSFAPRAVTLWIGIVGAVVAFSFFGGGEVGLPFLFVTGFAAAQFDLPRILEEAGRPVRIAFLAALPLAGAALVWQSTQPGDPRTTQAGALAGLLLAVVYVLGLSLLWQTRARRILGAAFTPLGKTALTNYLGASVIVWATTFVIPFGTLTDHRVLPLLTVAILATQWAASVWWLRRHRYGPVEHAWRVATWWRTPERAGHGVAGTPDDERQDSVAVADQRA